MSEDGEATVPPLERQEKQVKNVLGRTKPTVDLLHIIYLVWAIGTYSFTPDSIPPILRSLSPEDRKLSVRSLKVFAAQLVVLGLMEADVEGFSDEEIEEVRAATRRTAEETRGSTFEDD